MHRIIIKLRAFWVQLFKKSVDTETDEMAELDLLITRYEHEFADTNRAFAGLVGQYQITKMSVVDAKQSTIRWSGKAQAARAEVVNARQQGDAKREQELVRLAEEAERRTVEADMLRTELDVEVEVQQFAVEQARSTVEHMKSRLVDVRDRRDALLARQATINTLEATQTMRLSPAVDTEAADILEARLSANESHVAAIEELKHVGSTELPDIVSLQQQLQTSEG